jgi:Ca2+-binding RTX toxin-like protein
MKALMVLASTALLSAALIVPAASLGHDNGGNGGHGDGDFIPCDNPTVTGTNSHGDIVGTDGPDVIRGGNGSETIYGGAGDDRICGNHGSDTIYGQGGSDTLQGNHGADALVGGSRHDHASGGAGGGDTCEAEYMKSCEK